MKSLLAIVSRAALLACVGVAAMRGPLAGPLALWFTTLVAVLALLSMLQRLTPFAYARIEDHPAPRVAAAAIPAAFSLTNLLCGVSAAFAALPIVDIEHRAFVVLLLVMLAAIADAFDGFVARRLGLQSTRGASLDSAIDLASFGIATASALFLHLVYVSGIPVASALATAAVFFACVHVRLVRFTCYSQDPAPSGQKRNFVGLPSPAAAVGAMVACAVPMHPLVLELTILVIALLMISRFDYVSHSNSSRLPLYRYVITPGFLGSILLLVFVLLLGRFTSLPVERVLRVACALMLGCFGLYTVDAIRRGWVPSVPDVREEPEEARV